MGSPEYNAAIAASLEMPPPADRTAEQLLHRYLAAQRERQEIASIERDPDANEEARELEAVGWKALQLVWVGRW